MHPSPQSLFVIVAIAADIQLPLAATPRRDGIERSAFIVNGEIAEKPIPYQVNIQWTHNKNHRCGGTLIDNQHVLTAAHCVLEDYERVYPTSAFHVVLGDLKDTATGEVDEVVMGVAKIMAHKYNGKLFRYDVAVMKLKKKVTFTENIKALALPTSEVPPGTQCQTSGWGVTENGRSSNQLRYTAIDTVTLKECTDYLNHPRMGLDDAKGFEDRVLCAGNPAKETGAYRGDSGGPLVCSSNKGEISGITSFGNGKKGKWMTVFTSVFGYRKWIDEAIAKMANE